MDLSGGRRVLGINRDISSRPHKWDEHCRHREKNNASPSNRSVDVLRVEIEGEEWPNVTVGVHSESKQEKRIKVGNDMSPKSGCRT